MQQLRQTIIGNILMSECGNNLRMIAEVFIIVYII